MPCSDVLRDLVVVQATIRLEASRIQRQRHSILRLLLRRRHKVKRIPYPIPTQVQLTVQKPLLLHKIGILCGGQGLQAGELRREELLLEVLLRRWYRDVFGASLEGSEELWRELLRQSHCYLLRCARRVLGVWVAALKADRLLL